MNSTHRMSNAGPAHQHGVALAISLILLAVIAITSTVAMRSGIFSGLVAQNLRANQMAVQSAEMALRYCERLAMQDPPGLPVQPLPAVDTDRPQAWATVANWQAGGISFELPANVVNSPASSVIWRQSPQCLVEALELRRVRGAMDEVAYLVTARGFSPDYRVNAGVVTSGAEVWLQSLVRFTP